MDLKHSTVPYALSEVTSPTCHACSLFRAEVVFHPEVDGVNKHPSDQDGCQAHKIRGEQSFIIQVEITYSIKS